MNHYEAFLRLDIPVSKDTAAIKKAYQKLISHHHPEEDPQGFMQLHQAYKIALTYAQGTGTAKAPSAGTFSQPEKSRPSREETGYDGLFADLDGERVVDMSQQKKAFSRKLLGLKLYWLPIPLKRWYQFFSSEDFRLCRGEPECMETLFELVAGKIHTYNVLCFLLSRLWELVSWQKSEGKEALANRTQKCIAELNGQYSHYLKLNPAARAGRLIFPVLWYYQALPFYFKMLVSTFLLPVISCGSELALPLLLLGFYFLELCTVIWKSSRWLGIFHPTTRKKKGVLRFVSSSDSLFLTIVTIYAIMLHCSCCISFMRFISG